MTHTPNIQRVTFHATKPGPHVVVFGAIHGNEYCGPRAIGRAIEAFENGALALEHGRVTFVPICNPGAYAQNKRFLERNLNRHFYPKATHQYYEDHLDPILCGILDDADVLLDLHSYQSKGGAFCFLGTTSQEEINFSRALGVSTYIHGWADAFSTMATEEQRKASIGTTDYARQNANRAIAVTLECGHHHNEDNDMIGYYGIIRTLSYFAMVQDNTPMFDYDAQRCIKMKQVFYKEKSGSLIKSWHHGDFVKLGDVIAQYDDGEQIVAPEDGVLVLPKASTDHSIGAEWFYFGVETEFPVINQ